MNFERFCGIASAAMIVLIFAIVMWTGLWGPLWQNIKGGDLLTLAVSIIGWLVTIGIGGRAFVLSQRQIRLGADQIALQQQQIDDARLQLRQNTYGQLAAAATQKFYEVEKLQRAQAYLSQFSRLFPLNGRLDGWSRALYFARVRAQDFISHADLSAPLGVGNAIATIMARIHRMGDMMTNGDNMIQPSNTVFDFYEQPVREIVEAIRSLEQGLSQTIVNQQGEVMRLSAERDRFADPAARH